MTMIRYAEFEPALREKFELICASQEIDPRSFQVMAIINFGEFPNGFGRVYVRRNGTVRDYHAGKWLAEFEAELAERFGHARSMSVIFEAQGTCAEWGAGARIAN